MLIFFLAFPHRNSQGCGKDIESGFTTEQYIFHIIQSTRFPLQEPIEPTFGNGTTREVWQSDRENSQAILEETGDLMYAFTCSELGSCGFSTSLSDRFHRRFVPGNHSSRYTTMTCCPGHSAIFYAVLLLC